MSKSNCVRENNFKKSSLPVLLKYAFDTLIIHEKILKLTTLTTCDNNYGKHK